MTDLRPARLTAAAAGRGWRKLAHVGTACALLAPALLGPAPGRAADAASADTAGGLATAQLSAEVGRMLADISAELSRHGPRAWLRYFDDDPNFLMAVDGTLQFDGIAAARNFLETFAVGIRDIQLHWSDVRVDPLSPRIAAIAAAYREELTDRDGRVMRPSGYFTAVAVRTGSGWRLRAAHWSSAAAAP